VTTKPNPPYDWTNFFEGKGSYNGGGNAISIIPGAFPKVTTNGQFLNGVALPDYALPDPTTFATGSKDILPISGNGNNNWQCSSSNNVGNKVDIVNTYATVFVANANATSALPADVTHTILYFGMENASPNGDRNLGIWLLQDPSVSCNSAGGTKTFTGVHTDGDLLFAAAFTGGGGKPTSADIVAYRWNGPNLTGVMSAPIDIGKLCSASAPGDVACAITNSTSSITTPWSSPNTANGGSVALPATVSAQTFFEGGIDITGVAFLFKEPAPCFATFLTDTRSSQSTTATLFDYASGQLPTCGKPTINTQLSPGSIMVGQSVTDSATLGGVVIGTPTGTVTYTVYTNSDCTTPATTQINGQPGQVTLVTGNIPNSPPVIFLQTGTYYWQAVYSGGGVNPGATSLCGSEVLVVGKVPTTLLTTASTQAPIVVGTTVTISDSATISGAFGTPGGTMTFTLNGPATATSCGVVITTISVSVSGATTSSGDYSFKPTLVGTYYWSATWAGDSNNTGSSHAGCSVVNGSTVTDSSEAVLVVKATPILNTIMFLGDIANLSGGFSPQGTVTFNLYADLPTATTPCLNPAIATYGPVSINSLTANTLVDLTAHLAKYELSNGMVYNWQVVFSDTDGQNNDVTVGCGSSTGAAGSTSTESTGTITAS
jgi:hypothetical protein